MSVKLDRLCDVIEYRRRDLPSCNINSWSNEYFNKLALDRRSFTEVFSKRENSVIFVAIKKSETKIEWLSKKEFNINTFWCLGFLGVNL